MSEEALRQLEAETEGYVTAELDGQLFGLKLTQVRDVFLPKGICPVPMAPKPVAGLLNLRGRIVTAIDLRACLGLPARDPDAPSVAIGIERGNELYGLIADKIGNVLRPEPETFEPNPVNLGAGWADICAGVYRLDDGVLMVLDLEGILDLARPGGPQLTAA
ncbi:chemotaxis protein CheW [Methyloligella sp. 2.7D]|uniref:chemotaxis protein CheW n=1 Tax=unclassified Methyloligella TaxID=2625955 RepID=UPI00157CBBD6|nr:chemotaxis protein CheW [Methyloligella sp. GL2]QKP76921.1 chemotaxis protein CheW [Methyloligella sp. GL2]